MKISNDVADELKKVRNALDNMYDTLNVTLFEKKVAVKTTYKKINPYDGVSSNFSYIADKLKEIESSEINVQDKGNLIKAKNGVKISSNDGMEISSDESASIEDVFGNSFKVNKFVYKIPKKVISANKINYLDIESNNYLIEKGMLDLTSKKIIGKDIACLIFII